MYLTRTNQRREREKKKRKRTGEPQSKQCTYKTALHEETAKYISYLEHQKEVSSCVNNLHTFVIYLSLFASQGCIAVTCKH